MIVPCSICGEIARAVYHCLDKNCAACGGQAMPSFCSDECRMEYEDGPDLNDGFEQWPGGHR